METEENGAGDVIQVTPAGGSEGADPLPTSDSAALTFLIQEINSYLGNDFVKNIPLDLLESYCMKSIDRDEPTGKLLFSLITNFMRAYSNPATSDEAMKAYDFLDYLANPN